MQLIRILPFLALCTGRIIPDEAKAAFDRMQVVRSCKVPGMVALTFDDGPSEYTEQLLDLLKREKVRATFFVLGVQIDEDKKRAEKLLRRMWKEGHDIGSHTYDHPDLTHLSVGDIQSQMKRTDKLICDILGYEPRLMRPPYGYIDERVSGFLHGKGYTVVNWDVDSDDWQMIDRPGRDLSDHVTALIEPCTRKQSHIILFHDTHKPTIDAQRAIITDLRSKGYTFGNLSECLGDAVVYSDPTKQ